MTTAVQAFIFDMDGTIVDNMLVHAQTWLDLLAGEGVALTIEAFTRQTAGKTNPELLRQLLGPQLSAAQMADLAARKEALYRERYQGQLAPVAGLLPFLERARALEIPMALATSAGRENIAFVLGGLGIEAFFQAVVSGEELTHSKPHPEIFLTAAQKLGVAPEHCLAFEDAPAGIESARRAGMGVIALATTLSLEEAAQLPGVLRAALDFTQLEPDVLTAQPSTTPVL